jgi:hypothetical protein
MQTPRTKPARPVTWQDVDRLTRLSETIDAAHLVLHFGEHKALRSSRSPRRTLTTSGG